MLKNNEINLKVVERVAQTLGEINNEVIFVGGAVVGLYVKKLELIYLDLQKTLTFLYK